jgi:hypothetical protein
MLDDIPDARILGWQKARLADLGGTALVGSPTDFGKPIAEETEKRGKVTRAAHVKAPE